MLISIHAPARGATLLIQHAQQNDMTFQSTLPHGERLSLAGSTLMFVRFQSTLPHGERRGAGICSRNAIPVFQSTLPHGERLESKMDQLNASIKFQSTLPHGERQWIRSVRTCIRIFQSTLPHGERLRRNGGNDGIGYISIHAPARGATIMHRSPPAPILISIHAPARGATLATLPPPGAVTFYFNPRSRTGSDVSFCPV